MQTYGEYRPTTFDRAGAFLPDQSAWLVAPVGLNRDSDALEESNFHSALAVLGGESDTVQIHRFGHWACGWFEIIIIDPADAARVAEAEAIEPALADYPVINEGDWSEREWTRAADYWRSIGVRERVDWIKRYCRKSASIFAARRDEIPEDDSGELISALAA